MWASKPFAFANFDFRGFFEPSRNVIDDENNWRNAKHFFANRQTTASARWNRRRRPRRQQPLVRGVSRLSARTNRAVSRFRSAAFVVGALGPRASRRSRGVGIFCERDKCSTAFIWRVRTARPSFQHAFEVWDISSTARRNRAASG
jgi:hypothetical protein